MPLYCYSGIMMNLKAEKKSSFEKKKSNEPKLNKKPMLNRKELHMNPFFDNVLFRETVNKQLFCTVLEMKFIGTCLLCFQPRQPIFTNSTNFI